MFQAAMAELGVDVKVEELELATWIQRIVTTDEYDISWDFHQSRSADPAYTLALAFFYPPGPQNITRYKDDTLADLIEPGRRGARPGEAQGRSTTNSRSAGTNCSRDWSSASTPSSMLSPPT